MEYQTSFGNFEPNYNVNHSKASFNDAFNQMVASQSYHTQPFRKTRAS